MFSSVISHPCVSRDISRRRKSPISSPSEAKGYIERRHRRRHIDLIPHCIGNKSFCRYRATPSIYRSSAPVRYILQCKIRYVAAMRRRGYIKAAQPPISSPSEAKGYIERRHRRRHIDLIPHCIGNHRFLSISSSALDIQELRTCSIYFAV